MSLVIFIVKNVSMIEIKVENYTSFFFLLLAMNKSVILDELIFGLDFSCKNKIEKCKLKQR